jgi:hypothetical protein
MMRNLDVEHWSFSGMWNLDFELSSPRLLRLPFEILVAFLRHQQSA